MSSAGSGGASRSLRRPWTAWKYVSRWRRVPSSCAPSAIARSSVPTGSGSTALISRLRRGALTGSVAELREAVALGLALGLLLGLLGALALAALLGVLRGDDPDRRLERLVAPVRGDVVAGRPVGRAPASPVAPVAPVVTAAPAPTILARGTATTALTVAIAPPAATAPPAALVGRAVVDEPLDLAHGRGREAQPGRVGGIAGLQAASRLAARRGPLQRLALLVLLRPQRLAHGLRPADAVDRGQQPRAVDGGRRGRGAARRTGGLLTCSLGGLGGCGVGRRRRRLGGLRRRLVARRRGLGGGGRLLIGRRCGLRLDGRLLHGRGGLDRRSLGRG